MVQRRSAWLLRKDGTQNREAFHILGKCAWKAIRDRLRGPYYLSRDDHVRKTRDKRQRTDIRKYSFVNRTIKNWNQLPAEATGTFPCKPNIFRKRVRKAIIYGVQRKEYKCGEYRLKVQWGEVKCSDVRWNGAVGNLSGVKPTGTAVKCRWVKFKWEEVKWSVVKVLGTGCLSLLEDIQTIRSLSL